MLLHFWNKHFWMNIKVWKDQKKINMEEDSCFWNSWSNWKNGTMKPHMRFTKKLTSTKWTLLVGVEEVFQSHFFDSLLCFFLKICKRRRNFNSFRVQSFICSNNQEYDNCCKWWSKYFERNSFQFQNCISNLHCPRFAIMFFFHVQNNLTWQNMKFPDCGVLSKDEAHNAIKYPIMNLPNLNALIIQGNMDGNVCFDCSFF